MILRPRKCLCVYVMYLVLTGGGELWFLLKPRWGPAHTYVVGLPGSALISLHGTVVPTGCSLCNMRDRVQGRTTLLIEINIEMEYDVHEASVRRTMSGWVQVLTLLGGQGHVSVMLSMESVCVPKPFSLINHVHLIFVWWSLSSWTVNFTGQKNVLTFQTHNKITKFPQLWWSSGLILNNFTGQTWNLCVISYLSDV